MYKLLNLIREAQELADRNRQNYLVMNFEGELRVISIQGLRAMIRQKRFVKGFSVAAARNLALFEARPKLRTNGK